MALFDRGTATDALIDLCNRERDAVITADFDALARVLPEKTRLVEILNSRPGDDPRLPDLRRLILRNQTLLEAMGQGLRQATDRLRQTWSQKPLTTYDSAGQLQQSVSQSGKLNGRY